MKESPFSSEIQAFKKPLEVGDTNKIYYDPTCPELLIRVPIDEEAQFLESDPKLLGVAEKIYLRLGEMGKSLDIDIAPHQFILARETSDGPIKPMLITKRIEGGHLVPLDKSNPKTLEALSRIAQLGLKYLSWIETNKPKSVVTDIFRPEQYIVHPGQEREILTLVDVEPRLKDRNYGIEFIDHELGMLVCSLRDSEYNQTFNQYMRHAFESYMHNRSYSQMGALIHCVVNFPEMYKQMSEDFLSGRETTPPSEEVNDRIRNTPLIINKELLRKFEIDKI